MRKLLLVILTIVIGVTMTGCTKEVVQEQPVIPEIGNTAEEICTQQVINDFYKDCTVLGTNAALWYPIENDKSTEEVYMVQIETYNSCNLWLVGINYIKLGTKISNKEIIECYVMSKVR